MILILQVGMKFYWWGYPTPFYTYLHSNTLDFHGCFHYLMLFVLHKQIAIWFWLGVTIFGHHIDPTQIIMIINDVLK